MPAQFVQKKNYSLFPDLPLWYIPDSSPKMCIRDSCKAPRFEKGKAQEDGIAHASPDRAGNVVGRCDCLYQHRINCLLYTSRCV